LERFLQLCAEFNMQVCVPSTPAQMFHLLRRQMLRSLRKPLVILTPKSLLRHPLSVSRLEELSANGFQMVIDEIDDVSPSAVTRVVFCSGKVYFDLLKARRESKSQTVAVVRVEQLYPFPTEEYEAVLRKYENAREIIWCQEEPQNQGSWYQIRHRLQSKLEAKHELLYAGRAGAAAPATGIAVLHEQQQKNLVAAALQGVPPEEASRQTRASRPRKLGQVHNDNRSSGTAVAGVGADATLVSWHKKPGDSVARDENLVDLETDKVVLEVPAPVAGVLKEIKLTDGTTVTSGQVWRSSKKARPRYPAPALLPSWPLPAARRRKPRTVSRRSPPPLSRAASSVRPPSAWQRKTG